MGQQKSPSIIAIGVVAAIILGLVMGLTNWQPVSKTLNYLEGKGQQSMQGQAPASSVVGGPSLSASQINAILTNTESPAAGSQLYGIDNASALANDGNDESFHCASVESDVSTGRAA